MKLSSENGNVIAENNAGLKGAWVVNTTMHEFQTDQEVGAVSRDAFTGPAVRIRDGQPKRLVKTQEPTVGVFQPVTL
jgi:hypothetical protein